MKKILLTISVLAVIGLAVLNLTYQFGPEPDEVYPMANQQIIWNAGK